jgi:hypothetical protein
MTLCAGCAAVTYGSIWGLYRFRFNPSPDPAVHYNTRQFLDRAARGDLITTLHRATASREEFAAWRPSGSIRLALFALDHHLLPEAYLEGLLFARSASVYRISYLLGRVYTEGHWYYFPFAFLVKTPLATLGALLLAAATPVELRKDPRPASFLLNPAIVFSLLLFTVTAIISSINIGLRHIFPVYPLLYVAAAAGLARLHAGRPRFARASFAFLGLALAVETLCSYPNFIPFFNVAAGGSKGGLRLLGDSNLDWGQDLPLLAEWQRGNAGRTLYLAYFGSADPEYYGIHYHNLPQGYLFGPQPARGPVPTTGVVAISAYNLQLTNDSSPLAGFLNKRPTEILGGSIYLYDLGGD